MNMETNMETNQNMKKSKKKFWLLTIPVLAIALVTAIVLLSLETTLTVNEAFDVVTEEVSLILLPGNPNALCEQTAQVEITNLADWDLWAELTYHENSSGGVIYETNLPKIYTISSEVNILDVCFEVAEDSPTGEVTGTIMVSRIAQPA